MQISDLPKLFSVALSTVDNTDALLNSLYSLGYIWPTSSGVQFTGRDLIDGRVRALVLDRRGLIPSISYSFMPRTSYINPNMPYIDLNKFLINNVP